MNLTPFVRLLNLQLNYLRPHLLKQFLDSVVDGEGKGHLQADSVEPRQTSLVKAPDTLSPGQMLDTLKTRTVFSTLHSSLDHVEWGVAQDTGATLVLNNLISGRSKFILKIPAINPNRATK